MQKPEKYKPAAPPTHPHKKVHIITYGCQMNEADSELIAAAFASRGFRLSADLRAADAVVVNTCAVRQKAEDKALSQIGRLRKWKRERPHGTIFVVGCAAEKLGEKLIKAKFPFVDSVVGAKSIDRIGEVLDGWLGKGAADVPAESLFTSPVSAYVTIMRGCSLKCSYCVVPSVRGEAGYLPPEEILREARARADGGAREIIFLGQTVNSYRHGRTGFADLLRRAAGLDNVKRIRFMSPHPLYFDEKFFRAFAEEPKLARHVHLPVQSGSDRMLKAMRRGYGRARYLEILEKLRAAAPETAVSTDFIVGYPGETEQDFRDTLSLVREGGFAFAFCFKYSQRGNAKALEPDLAEKETEERLERLLCEVKKNSHDILNARIGKMEEVLLETADSGRTSSDFKVKLDSGAEAGELVRAEIYGAYKNVLKGRTIS